MSSSKKYWLFKSEPNSYSIDDFAKDLVTAWEGVRNYQARNFLRDSIKIGDEVLFYHSNSEPNSIVGLAKVCSKPYPDKSAFDENDKHFDAKSKRENPTWILVDIKFIKKFTNPISLHDLKNKPELDGMVLLQKGSRLSIQPVSKDQFDFIKKISK